MFCSKSFLIHCLKSTARKADNTLHHFRGSRDCTCSVPLSPRKQMIASYFWHKAVGVGKIWNSLPHRAELIPHDANGSTERSRWKHLLVVAREPPTGTRHGIRAPRRVNSPGTRCSGQQKAQVRPGKHKRLFGAEDL